MRNYWSKNRFSVYEFLVIVLLVCIFIVNFKFLSIVIYYTNHNLTEVESALGQALLETSPTQQSNITTAEKDYYPDGKMIIISDNGIMTNVNGIISMKFTDPSGSEYVIDAPSEKAVLKSPIGEYGGRVQQAILIFSKFDSNLTRQENVDVNLIKVYINHSEDMESVSLPIIPVPVE